jgi:hypothetical protein
MDLFGLGDLILKESWGKIFVSKKEKKKNISIKKNKSTQKLRMYYHLKNIKIIKKI